MTSPGANSHQPVARFLIFQSAAEKARLLAVSSKDASCWLNALPSPSVGTFLDNDALRISVALRLGASVCLPHSCRCGEEVDETGRHGLKCKKSAGRFRRHASVNDVIFRALSSAGLPFVLEPPGLIQEDGRRPDGITQFPWRSGKQMVWDFSCIDTLAPSNLKFSSELAGLAADEAETKKVFKYRDLESRFIFVPICVETLGSLGSAAKGVISEIGRRITLKSGEPRATQFLKQRIAIEIQRGNAASVLGTCVETRSLDEIFNILSIKGPLTSAN